MGSVGLLHPLPPLLVPQLHLAQIVRDALVLDLVSCDSTIHAYFYHVRGLRFK